MLAFVLSLMSPFSWGAPPCSPPNEINAVKETVSKGHANDGKNCREGRTTHSLLAGTYLDVPGLNMKDKRWGYLCKDSACNQLDTTHIAYYCGNGEPSSSSDNVAVVKILKSCDFEKKKAPVVWEVQNTKGRWKFPYARWNCGAIERKRVTFGLAERNPRLFENSCKNLDWAKKLVEELRKKEPAHLSWRWGYHCQDQGCSRLSGDRIAFYCGDSRPSNGQSHGVGIYRIAKPHCTSYKERQYYRDHNSSGGWTFGGNIPNSGSGNTGGGGNSGGGGNTGNVSTDLRLSEAKGIARQIANQYPEALKRAYNSYPKEDGDLKNHSRTEYWDRVVQKLHSIDEGFGYVLDTYGRYRTDLLCFVPSAYRSSQGNPTGNRTEYTGVDFIAGGDPAWPNWSVWPPEKKRQKYPSGHATHKDRCVFPRPGAPDYGYVNAGGGSGTNHTKIVGACGSYKGASDASCQSGKFAVGPGDTEMDYRWVCQNIPNDGQTVCSEPRPNPVILGRCNSYQGANDDSCATGQFHSHPPDTDTEFLWTCRNIPHNGEMDCSEQRPDPVTVGQCGPYQGDGDASCVSGEFHPHPGHTQAEYRWICRNVPHKRFEGKREEECQQSKAETVQNGGNIPENSSNNSSVVLGKCGKIYWGAHDASCESGKFHPSPGNTSTEFRWSCRNMPYDGGADTCQLPKPAVLIRMGR